MSNLLILTGPSGVGKDSLVDMLIDSDYPILRPPTMTTRVPRPGEIEGIHHFFVSPDEFQEHVDNQDLLENAYVYGNRYGVPRQSVNAALEAGNDVVIRVDVQGAFTIQDFRGSLFCQFRDRIIRYIERPIKRESDGIR